MTKIKIKKDLFADVEGDEIELDVTDYLPDGHTVVPEGKLKNVGERVASAYENAKQKILSGELEEFDDFLEQFKNTHGLSEAGGEPGEKWTQKYVAPVKTENEQLRSEVEELRNRNQRRLEERRDQQIIEAAREAGFDKEWLKTEEDKNDLLKLFRDNFELNEDDEQWVWKDENGFRYSQENGNEYAGPKEFFTSNEVQQRYSRFIENKQNTASNFQPEDTIAGGRALTDADLDALSPEQVFQKLQAGELDVGEKSKSKVIS